MDLEEDRKVLNEVAYDFAKDESLNIYFETSAATRRDTIDSLFAWLGEELIKHPDVVVNKSQAGVSYLQPNLDKSKMLG